MVMESTNFSTAITDEPQQQRTEAHHQACDLLFVDVLNGRWQVIYPGLKNRLPAQRFGVHVNHTAARHLPDSFIKH